MPGNTFWCSPHSTFFMSKMNAVLALFCYLPTVFASCGLFFRNAWCKINVSHLFRSLHFQKKLRPCILLHSHLTRSADKLQPADVPSEEDLYSLHDPSAYFPFLTIRVVLIKQVIISLKPAKTVWIIHPVFIRKKNGKYFCNPASAHLLNYLLYKNTPYL